MNKDFRPKMMDKSALKSSRRNLDKLSGSLLDLNPLFTLKMLLSRHGSRTKLLEILRLKATTQLKECFIEGAGEGSQKL
jgi:hypothetical protein